MSVTDTFNRADAGSLGANWAEFVNGYKIVSNQADAVNAGSPGQRAYYIGAAAGTDQFSAATVGTGLATNGGFDTRVFVRLSGSGTTVNGYELAWGDTRGTNVVIFRLDSGGETTLQTTSLTVAPGDVMRLEVEGSTLRAYQNGVQIGTNVTDANHTTGEVGIHGYFTGYDVFDAWEGGDLAAGVTAAQQAGIRAQLQSGVVIGRVDA